VAARPLFPAGPTTEGATNRRLGSPQWPTTCLGGTTTVDSHWPVVRLGDDRPDMNYSERFFSSSRQDVRLSASGAIAAPVRRERCGPNAGRGAVRIRRGPLAVPWEGVTSDSSARVIAQQGEDALFEAAFRTGDFEGASRRLQEALAASQTSGDTSTEAFVIDRLGTVAHYRNIMRLIDGEDIVEADMAAEEALFRRALELREALGDVAGAAQSLFGVGLVHQVLRGDWSTAIGYYTRAFSLAGEAGTALDLYSRSEIHRHLGFYFLVEEVDLEKAVDHLDISLELRERLADERLVPSALVALGQAEAAAGNRRRAIELLERAVACARSARLSGPWLDDAEQALAETLGGLSE
jgi:hypothetical protein